MTLTDASQRAAGSDILAVLGRLAAVFAAGASVALFMLGVNVVRELEQARVEDRARIVQLEEKARSSRSAIEALGTRISATEALAAGVGARIDAQGRTLDRIERLLERQQSGD